MKTTAEVFACDFCGISATKLNLPLIKGPNDVCICGECAHIVLGQLLGYDAKRPFVDISAEIK